MADIQNVYVQTRWYLQSGQPCSQETIQLEPFSEWLLDHPHLAPYMELLIANSSDSIAIAYAGDETFRELQLIIDGD
jgi:hypothetical protein